MFQGGYGERTVTKFGTHPKKKCEDCAFLDPVEESKRGHIDYYCRALPVPARIGQPVDKYWCGMHERKGK